MSRLDIGSLAAHVKARRGSQSLREIEIPGVSISTLSRLENGKMINVETFLAVCDWLRVSPQQFIIESEDSASTRPLDAVEHISVLLYQEYPEEFARAMTHLLRMMRKK